MDIPFFLSRDEEEEERESEIRSPLLRKIAPSPPPPFPLLYRVAVPGCSPCLPIAIWWKSVQRLLPKKRGMGRKNSLGTRKKETREDFRFLWPVLRSIIFLFPSLPSKIRYFHGERKEKRGEGRIRQQHMNGPSSSPPPSQPPKQFYLYRFPFSLLPPFSRANSKCPLSTTGALATHRRTYNVQTMDNWT